MKKIVLISTPLLIINLVASDTALLKQKCANNDATACYELGVPLTQGDNAKVQDILDEGMSYMRKACHNGEDRACDIIGIQYYKNKNYAYAKKFLTKSCNRGIKTACEAVGVIYRDGHDVKQNDVQARKFFTKACALKSGDACYNVAIIYRGGFGVEKNRTIEKAFYKKGCDAELKAACDRFTELDNEDKGIETGILSKIKGWFK